MPKIYAKISKKKLSCLKLTYSKDYRDVSFFFIIPNYFWNYDVELDIDRTILI